MSNKQYQIKYRKENRKKLNKNILDYYKKYPWKKTLSIVKQRCTNPNNDHYKYYGERGIQCLITEEELKHLWFRDKAYLMDKPSIDREDNDGNYKLSNCRFIEMGKNSAERNTRFSSKPILQHDLNGNFIKEWASATQAGVVLNIHNSNITNTCKMKQNLAGGFVWRYKNE